MANVLEAYSVVEGNVLPKKQRIQTKKILDCLNLKDFWGPRTDAVTVPSYFLNRHILCLCLPALGDSVTCGPAWN